MTAGAVDTLNKRSRKQTAKMLEAHTFSLSNDHKLRAPAVPSTIQKDKLSNMLCDWCHTTSAPQWRKGPAGFDSLCNACGVRFSRTGTLDRVTKHMKGVHDRPAWKPATRGSTGRPSKARAASSDSRPRIRRRTMTAGAASSHPNNRKVDGQAACSMLGSGLCGVQQQQVPCPLLDHLADIASELSEAESFSEDARQEDHTPTVSDVQQNATSMPASPNRRSCITARQLHCDQSLSLGLSRFAQQAEAGNTGSPALQATSLGGIGMHATSDGEGDGDDVCRSPSPRTMSAADSLRQLQTSEQLSYSDEAASYGTAAAAQAANNQQGHPPCPPLGCFSLMQPDAMLVQYMNMPSTVMLVAPAGHQCGVHTSYTLQGLVALAASLL
eukprot:jgi/Chrzof1/7142/Cz02g12190.t1